MGAGVSAAAATSVYGDITPSVATTTAAIAQAAAAATTTVCFEHGQRAGGIHQRHGGRRLQLLYQWLRHV